VREEVEEEGGRRRRSEEEEGKRRRRICGPKVRWSADRWEQEVAVRAEGIWRGSEVGFRGRRQFIEGGGGLWWAGGTWASDLMLLCREPNKWLSAEIFFYFFANAFN
jgi:hypothetical protein